MRPSTLKVMDHQP